MSFLVLKAYMRLLQLDWYVARSDFGALYKKVRTCPVGKGSVPACTAEQICKAVDLACIWYWKEVLCLQRSAATACLLRCYGVPAEMMIGIQQMPFKAHAWVEVNGCVVNDRPYMHEMYVVLDHC
jgi:hypothetical protein